MSTNVINHLLDYCGVLSVGDFEERIRGVKNFSNVWITGLSNHKCSNVLDHARSNKHKAAMTRLRVEQSRAPARASRVGLLTQKLRTQIDCFDDTACMYYLSVLKIFFSHVNNL